MGQRYQSGLKGTQREETLLGSYLPAEDAAALQSTTHLHSTHNSVDVDGEVEAKMEYEMREAKMKGTKDFADITVDGKLYLHTARENCLPDSHEHLTREDWETQANFQERARIAASKQFARYCRPPCR